MEKWEYHQKHDADINRILKDQGCMDSKGRIRAWKGEKTWKAIKEKGHSSVGFEECNCWKAN